MEISMRKTLYNSRISDSNLITRTLSIKDSKLSVLDMIIFFSNKNKSVYFTQTYIAKKLKITREHVNRLIKELCSLGLVYKVGRYMTSCLYYIHYGYRDFSIRKQLWSILPSLGYLPIAYLATVSGMDITLDSHSCFINTTLHYTTNTNTSDYDSKRGEMMVKNVGVKKIQVVEPKKKVSFMSDLTIPEYISKIKNPNFTQYGQIKLSMFPEEAIKYCVAQYKKQRSVANPFKWFMKVAGVYCKEKGLRTEWTKVAMVVEKVREDDGFVMLSHNLQQSHSSKPITNIPSPKQYTRNQPNEQLAIMLSNIKQTEKNIAAVTHSFVVNPPKSDLERQASK